MSVALFDPDAPQAERAAVEARAGELVRDEYGAAPGLDPAAARRLGELLGRRRALFESWEKRVSARGLSLVDTNGRTVQRSLTRPVLATVDRIGVKPRFDDSSGLAEGSEAGFDDIAVAPTGEAIAKPGLKWTMSKVDTNYQWFRDGSQWKWEASSYPAPSAPTAFTLREWTPTRMVAPPAPKGESVHVAGTNSPH